MICHTGNGHFGDCFWCLLAMSKIPGAHTLHCRPDYHAELRGIIEGLPITITGMENVPGEAYNCWIASGQFPGIHYADDIDIMGFVMRYFNAMTQDAGHGVVFKSRADLLCDFPALAGPGPYHFADVLVINADPKSGQCPRYSSSEMDALIERLHSRGHLVATVEKQNLTMAQIGRMRAKIIVGCATGPWWATLLTTNADTPRIVLLDPMRLDYGPTVPIEHAANAAQAGEILERMGWL